MTLRIGVVLTTLMMVLAGCLSAQDSGGESPGESNGADTADGDESPVGSNDTVTPDGDDLDAEDASATLAEDDGDDGTRDDATPEAATKRFGPALVEDALTRAAAESRARDLLTGLDGDFVLNSLAAFEGPAGFAAPESVEDEELPLAGDAVVGDGKSPQWFFSFHRNGTHEFLEIVIYANGSSIVDPDPEHASPEEAVSLPSPELDAAAAFAAARSVPEFADASNESAYSLMSVLVPPGAFSQENVSWLLDASPSKDNQVLVIVDGNSGEAMNLLEHMMRSMAEASGGEFHTREVARDDTEGNESATFTFTGTGAGDGHKFEVREGRSLVHVNVTWSSGDGTEWDASVYEGFSTRLERVEEDETGLTFAVQGPGRHEVTITSVFWPEGDDVPEYVMTITVT